MLQQASDFLSTLPLKFDRIASIFTGLCELQVELLNIHPVIQCQVAICNKPQGWTVVNDNERIVHEGPLKNSEEQVHCVLLTHKLLILLPIDGKKKMKLLGELALEGAQLHNRGGVSSCEFDMVSFNVQSSQHTTTVFCSQSCEALDTWVEKITSQIQCAQRAGIYV